MGESIDGLFPGSGDYVNLAIPLLTFLIIILLIRTARASLLTRSAALLASLATALLAAAALLATGSLLTTRSLPATGFLRATSTFALLPFATFAVVAFLIFSLSHPRLLSTT